ITEKNLHIDVSPDQGYDANGTYEIRAVDTADNESSNGPNDSFDVEYKEPEISELEIDCSRDEGFCVSGGNDYPVNFSVTNAISCTATVEKISGTGTPGSVSSVTLNGTSGSFTYTTGSTAFDVIRITVECIGAKETKSSYIDKTLD
ncbi:hypothetical protein JXA05_02445, partial [Candidatus Peregrinibacteria bacterium]|nr:hypothetical protein [Candidatus Peregrinibacteria bacterium]